MDGSFWKAVTLELDPDTLKPIYNCRAPPWITALK